tara:strand:- start:1141 stop:1671 length:531 start_codon:yes stop_codon:yes gene_type:complete
MITLEVYGVGFELSLGEIDKSKFEYWKDKEISEEDGSKKSDKFNLFKDHWTDLSNIYHDNGPAMLENTKLEIKKNNKIILETYLGKDDIVNSKINFKEHQIKIDKSYYFLGYQYDKGTFYKTELEAQSFDINKLLISYETIAGFSIITDIEYDGESIDKGDYSTTTKEISLNVNQK